jgi:thymidylate synthase
MTPVAVEGGNRADSQAQAKANASSNGHSAPAPRHEEYQYLDLIRRIMDEGEHRPDR